MSELIHFHGPTVPDCRPFVPPFLAILVSSKAITVAQTEAKGAFLPRSVLTNDAIQSPKKSLRFTLFQNIEQSFEHGSSAITN